MSERFRSWSRAAVTLLLAAALYEALVPDGLMVIGNVAVQNPSRYMMEYFSDWFLIHRAPADFKHHAEALKPPPHMAEVDAEPLGINLFLLVRK